MATTSLWPIHNTGSRGVKSVVKQLVNYAENEEKTVKKTGLEAGGGSGGSNALRSVIGYVSKDEKVNQERAEKPFDLSSPGEIDAESDDEVYQMIMRHLSSGSEIRRYVTGIISIRTL